MKNDYFGLRNAPSCMGTGLIALDVVMNELDESKASLWAGGSCGNVMSSLSFLGWSTYPIANHKCDIASDLIKKDMSRWGVKTQFILNSITGITPIVVERLQSNGNTATHKFQFVCPVCGAQLPRNRPISLSFVEKINREIPSANVFYFDRVSKGAIALAKEQKSRGAMIVFEPVLLSQERLFKECLELAHIVKYSAEQIDISHFETNIPLEVQTLGSKGLRYKRSSQQASNKWKDLPAFNVLKIVDSAGAGDWCTTGLIHSLGQDGLRGFLNASDEAIENGLLFGEALAAIKCRFKGARGIMYSLSKAEFECQVQSILEGKGLVSIRSESEDNESQTMGMICSSCKS